jgi:hypothetical protein
MRLNHLALLLATSIACASANAAPVLRTADDKPLQTLASAQSKVHADAMNAFRLHRYPAAFGRFAYLADAGHVPSAEVALMMFRHGSTLFGSDWAASVPQQASWHALVINNARARAVAVDDAKGE